LIKRFRFLKGGKKSHEYHIESLIGEDKIFTCNQCNKSISFDLVEHSNENKDQISSAELCKIIGCNHHPSKSNELIDHKKCIEIGHTFILGIYYQIFCYQNAIFIEYFY